MRTNLFLSKGKSIFNQLQRLNQVRAQGPLSWAISSMREKTGLGLGEKSASFFL
jgi:hypothetical protein